MVTMLIESINNDPEEYVLTYKGDISNYLGVYIKNICTGHLNDPNHTWWIKLSAMWV